MRAPYTTLGLAAALAMAMTMAGQTALAGPGNHDRNYQPLLNHQSHFIQRYPGDQAFEGGTVRVHGPDKGPYIERCFWAMDATKPGFGLTQRCYRYTLDNTPPLQ